ncbi:MULTISPECIES: hypothetical protein [unclassified Mesorhizobium]|uniref:hypothetical protein n=1 Tax=unclassified Mesorhizobium TaxID=325217 RepID=UPI0029821396|nr:MULTISPECIES: hypothetical protein [unclassified Mesorhizobium]
MPTAIRRFQKMMQIKAQRSVCKDHDAMWKPIQNAPFGRDLELAVFDEDGEHALVFPCQRMREGWKNMITGARVDIRPTHWRHWAPDKTLTEEGGIQSTPKSL